MPKSLLICEASQVLTYNKLCDQHVATLRGNRKGRMPLFANLLTAASPAPSRLPAVLITGAPGLTCRSSGRAAGTVVAALSVVLGGPPLNFFR